ncbi:unnamed protein product, partial [Effrenium voratum]
RGLLTACAAAALCRWTVFSTGFVGAPRSSLVARHASLKDFAGADMSSLEEMMKDPEKMKKMQGEIEKIMQDPDKRKQIEEYQKMTEQAVDKLKDDPELKDFFEDVKKNGIDAMKKYENDERILEKFSKATGGAGVRLEALWRRNER